MNAPSSRPRFSTLQLFAVVTFAALMIGVLAIGYRASVDKRSLRNQLVEKTMQVEKLQSELSNALMQARRTQFAERMFFHIYSQEAQYTELKNALRDYGTRKLGISFHPLDDNDNQSFVCFYSMNRKESEPPFCHAFLVEESPFSVIDDVVGEQARTPRIENEKWFFGAGQGGADCWYTIENSRFNKFLGDRPPQ